MNISLDYSCYDGEGLREDSVTWAYWQSNGTVYEKCATASATLTMLFFLVGLPSNLLIIVSIIWQRLYKQPTYVLLLNLAIVDLLLCAVSMPAIVIVGFARALIFGRTDIVKCQLCQTQTVIHTLLINLTVFLLGAISVDRLIFMKWAIKYHTIVSAKHYVITCIGLWLYSSMVAVFPLFGIGDVVFRNELSACTLKYVGKTTITKNLYYPIFLVLQGLIPIAFILITSVWLLCIILKQMKKVSGRNQSQKQNTETNKKLKKPTNLKQLRLIKVFGVIWLANLISWFPYIIRVIFTFFLGEIWSNSFYVFSFMSLMISAVTFPIIEASIIPELRTILASLFKRIFCFRPNITFRLCCSSSMDTACGCLDVLNTSSEESDRNSV